VAEVYFEGIGWVEFEPTASQPVPTRPGGEGVPAPTVPPIPSEEVRWWQQIPWALVGLGGLLLLLVSGIVWLWRLRRSVTPDDLVRDRQARLLRWGARLGYPLRDGQTTHEYGQALAQSLRAGATLRPCRGHVGPAPRSRPRSTIWPAFLSALNTVRNRFPTARPGRSAAFGSAATAPVVAGPGHGVKE